MKMYKWSKSSAERLLTCDTNLILLFNTVLLHRDCTILDGHRDEERQNQYYKEGKSKLPWDKSKHNRFPSKAVDARFCPYNPDLDDDNREKWMEFRGFVYGIAAQLGIKLSKTIQWDLPHFELRD